MSLLPPTATLPPGYLLRRMRPSDTSVTARLHRRLLPHGLFPRLGQRFVARWHATFLDTPAATGLSVVHHGEVVAFVLATLDQRLYLHHVLRRHRRPLLWRGALALAARPHVAVRFVRTRLRTYARHLLPGLDRQVTSPPGPADGGGDGRAGGGAGRTPSRRRPRVAVVHAVVTAEPARGLGCARALLDAVVAAAARARADHVALVTDVDDQDDRTGPFGAAAMYEALGWRRTEVRRQRDGRWVAEYRTDLAPSGRPGTSPRGHGVTCLEPVPQPWPDRGLGTAVDRPAHDGAA